jgi:hypothetical protein
MPSTWFKWYRELNNFPRCIVGVTNGCSLSYLEDCEECNELVEDSFISLFIIRSAF